MATPRVTPNPVCISKALADFPAYAEANEKLQGFESELAEIAAHLKNELAVPRDVRIAQDAQAVLEGGSVAVQICNVGELQRRRDVLAATVESQSRLVEEQRKIASKEITIELRPKQRATIERFIQQQDEALASYDEAQQIFTAAEAATAGASGLPELAVVRDAMLRYRYGFDRFKAIAPEILSAK